VVAKVGKIPILDPIHPLQRQRVVEHGRLRVRRAHGDEGQALDPGLERIAVEGEGNVAHSFADPRATVPRGREHRAPVLGVLPAHAVEEERSHHVRHTRRWKDHFVAPGVERERPLGPRQPSPQFVLEHAE
jgi:hypothetical protein